MIPLHYMIVFSILSGLLSTMNIWADKLSDIRLSLNDFYMALLMTGWMLLFEGIYMMNMHNYMLILGGILVIFSFFAIRTQLFVTVNQYRLGMIPHHSMAVHMSKKLIENNDNNPKYIRYIRNKLGNMPWDIITGQEREINFMKNAIT